MQNKAGHPLKFKSLKSLQVRINAYFRKCDKRTREVIDKNGNTYQVSSPEPYTVSGLAYHLGTNRQTLINYGNKEKYIDTIRSAKARIESDVERRLLEGQAAGPIFSLKNNFNWKDKSELETTNEIKIISDTH